MFELFTWPYDPTGDRAFVKIMYNHEVISLPGCFHTEGQCAFSQFEMHLQESSFTNWYEGCGAKICFEQDVIVEDRGKEVKKSKLAVTTTLVDEMEMVAFDDMIEAALPSDASLQDINDADSSESNIDLQFSLREAFILAAGIAMGCTAMPLKNLLFCRNATQGQHRHKRGKFKVASGSAASRASGFSPTLYQRTVSVKQT